MPQMQTPVVEPRTPGASPVGASPSIPAPVVWEDLTPEQKATFKPVSAPPSVGLDPIVVLPPDKYVEFMAAHPENPSLNPDQWALDNPDRVKEAGMEGKLADITAIAEQRGLGGFLDTLKNKGVIGTAAGVASGVYDFAKGTVKTIYRGGKRLQTPVGYPLEKYVARPLREKLGVSGLLKKVGVDDSEPSLEKEAVKDIESLSAVEASQNSFLNMLRIGLEKGGAFLGRLGVNNLKRPESEGGAKDDPYGIVNLFTPPEEKDPEQRLDHFRSLVARAASTRAAGEGKGAITTAITGGVADALEKQGFKVDPDNIASLVAGDPLAIVEFGGAFKLVNAAGKTLASAASRTEAARLIQSAQAAQRNLVRATVAEESAARELAAQKAAFERGGPVAAPGLADAPDALRASQAATADASASHQAAESAVKASPVASGVRGIQRAANAVGGGIVGGINQIPGVTARSVSEGVRQAGDIAVEKLVGNLTRAGGAALKGAGDLGTFALGFVPPLATPRRLVRSAELLSNVGEGIAASGKRLADEPLAVSPRLRLLSDVIRSSPEVAAGAAKGFLTVDLPLAAVTSEFPSDEYHAPALGAAFGAAGGVIPGLRRIYQGQEAREFSRNWATGRPISNYGNSPVLDAATKETLARDNNPAEASRLSALREAFDPLGVEIHYIKDPAISDPDRPGQSILKTVLEKVQPGMDPQWYDDATRQRGVTLLVTDRLGNRKPVIILNDLEAGIHEGVHVIERVLGPTASARIHQYIREANAPIWEQVGQNYARNFLQESGRSLADYAAKGEGWREVLIDAAQGSPDWRKTWTPEQIDQVADSYVSSELLGEAGDVVLRNKGPKLLDDPGLIGKLSRTLGKMLVGMGVEPFEGVKSEGQGIPVSQETAALVQKALREGIEFNKEQKRFDRVNKAVQPPQVTPRGSGGDNPPPSGGSSGGPAPSPAPPAPTKAADYAREVAASAPTTPNPRGVRSPQEILNDIANAIESRGGVAVDYLSAPGEPAGSITQNRVTRRAVIEAFRDMPAAARALWEKNFYPEQVIQTGKGIQVMGWTPEVFAANAHKLAKALTSAKQVGLSPYPIDIKTGTFTEHGWRQLFDDANAFMKNQQAGLTGAGNILVTPPEVVARGFRAPETTGAAPASLSQNRADVISALFGIKLPKTPRIGKVYPRNLAGQEVSAATEPGRVSSPVEPRKPFSGPKAAEMGIEGREIQEVNPFRAVLEGAGIKVDAIEAIQRLNVDNIADVTPLPVEPVPFRANEFTLQAGFQPKAGDKALYDNLTGEFGKLSLEDKFGAKGTALRKQIEEIKNRSNGMPPAADGEAAPEGAKFQPKTDSGKSLEDNGFEIERTGFPGFRAVTVKKDGAVAGEILSSRSHENPNEVVIGGVDVKPSFRRQGIGEAMYRELLTDLQEDGVKTVTGYPISAPPIKLRDRLLPGTKYEAAGKAVTMQQAMLGTPEVAKQLGLPAELATKMTSQLTGDMKFQPSDAKDAIKGAAVKLRDGRIFEGELHPIAFDNAQTAIRTERTKNGKIPHELGIIDTVDGYVTNSGEFLNREEAYARAVSLKQVKPQDMVKEGLSYDQSGKTGSLETDSFQNARRFQPSIKEDNRTGKEDYAFSAKTDAGKKLEDSGLKISRKTFTENGDYAARIEVHNKQGDRVGFIETMDLPAQEAGELPMAEVMMVRVDPPYQRKGIAETLYREALTDLQSHGIKEVTGFIIRSGPAQIREKLLPGLSQFHQAGRPLTVEEAMNEVQGRHGIDVRTKLPPFAKFQPGNKVTNPEAEKLGREHAKESNLLEPVFVSGRPLPTELLKQAADALEDTPHAPDDPKVKSGYRVMLEEMVKQGKKIIDSGVDVEPWPNKGEPYKSSQDMVKDVTENKHLFFLPTDTAFGAAGGLAGAAPEIQNNLLTKPSGIVRHGYELNVNEVLRFVHDYFGHTPKGNDFGPKGEFNALLTHIQMFPEEAQAALLSELFMQSSWFFAGRHIRRADGTIPKRGEPDFIPYDQRQFADPKNLIAPPELFANVMKEVKAAREGVATSGESSAPNKGDVGTKVELQAGQFQPKKDDPRAVKGAAIEIQEPDKKPVVIEGSLHATAYEKADEQGLIKYGPTDQVITDGYITNDGKFLDREAAFERARELKQLTAKDAKKINRNFDVENTLESGTFNHYRRFQPKVKATGWILPNGKYEPLKTDLHESDLAEKSASYNKQFGTDFGTKSDVMDRNKALRAGFVRVRTTPNGDMTIEMDQAFVGKQRSPALKVALANQGRLNDLTVNVVNRKGRFVDGGSENIYMSKDPEADIRSLINGLKGGAAEVGAKEPTLIQKARSYPDAAKFQPRTREEAEAEIARLGFEVRPTGRTSFAAYTDTGEFYGNLKATDPESAVFEAVDYVEGSGKPARFQPRHEDELGLGLAPLPLSTREISEMNQKQKRVYYPEAVVPKSQTDTVASDIVDSPLYKSKDSESAAADAFSKRLVDFANQYKDDPAYQLGLRWYSDFTPMLKEKFGKDAPLMAELLAATSPNTNPQVNFGYAYDALRSMQTERFKKIVPKFEDGLAKMENGSWESWYNKELKAGNVTSPPETPTPAAFMAHWIEKYDLKPRQSNGALYGMHGVRVLQVLARRWMDLNAGPKTRNFVGNLLGEGHEATVDVWADRTMRWAGYEGFNDRWRILPENAVGVSDPDFAFGQLTFRRAAKQLGVSPDALQGGLWFAEKKRWTDNGWGRLDLGDFRKEMANLPYLESDFNQRVKITGASKKSKQLEQLGLAVESRK